MDYREKTYIIIKKLKRFLIWSKYTQLNNEYTFLKTQARIT